MLLHERPVEHPGRVASARGPADRRHRRFHGRSGRARGVACACACGQRPGLRRRAAPGPHAASLRLPPVRSGSPFIDVTCDGTSIRRAPFFGARGVAVSPEVNALSAAGRATSLRRFKPDATAPVDSLSPYGGLGRNTEDNTLSRRPGVPECQPAQGSGGRTQDLCTGAVGSRRRRGRDASSAGLMLQPARERGLAQLPWPARQSTNA